MQIKNDLQTSTLIPWPTPQKNSHQLKVWLQFCWSAQFCHFKGFLWDLLNAWDAHLTPWKIEPFQVSKKIQNLWFWLQKLRISKQKPLCCESKLHFFRSFDNINHQIDFFFQFPEFEASCSIAQITRETLRFPIVLNWMELEKNKI